MPSICRLCLGKPETVHSLLEKNNFDMLDALTSIKVLSDDSSTVACSKCIDELTQAFKTQQRILQINEKFKIVVVEVSDCYKIENRPLDTAPVVYKTCPVCALAVEERELKLHTQAHFDCPQYCDLCQDTFPNLKQYKEHWINLHKSEGTFKCTMCDLQFRYRCIYWSHMNQAHDSKAPFDTAVLKQKENDVEGQKQGSSSQSHEPSASPQQAGSIDKELDSQERLFGCSVCQKQFKSKVKLNAHKVVHKPRKPCTVCHAQVSFANYKAHVTSHKLDPRVCELCGSVLRNTFSLRAHMNIIHTTFKKACEECGRVFTHLYRYQLHMKKHKGEKAHVCEQCGKGFLTLYRLNCHMKTIHLKLKPHVCSFCQKAFQSKFGLKTHERQHTNETPYRCEVCGEGFRQNISLRNHRKSKHNIVEPKNCKCEVCGKEFVSEHAVKSHMRLH